MSEKVDALFKNSDAETKTETEKAFAAGFISMSSAIITGLQIVSYVIIGIIFLVLCNTMLMAARERTREYAVLKTLGFTSGKLSAIIFGESIAIGVIGGLLGILLTYPVVGGFAVGMARFFPFVIVDPLTVILAGSFAVSQFGNGSRRRARHDTMRATESPGIFSRVLFCCELGSAYMPGSLRPPQLNGQAERPPYNG